jgi:hypothetical protein
MTPLNVMVIFLRAGLFYVLLDFRNTFKRYDIVIKKKKHPLQNI